LLYRTAESGPEYKCWFGPARSKDGFHFRRDAFNILVIEHWRQFAISSALFAATSLILKFTGYDSALVTIQAEWRRRGTIRRRAQGMEAAETTGAQSRLTPALRSAGFSRLWAKDVQWR
jgi:hypothetical protein